MIKFFISIILIILFSNKAFGETCYTAQIPGFVDRTYHMVRGDALLVNPGDETKDNIEQIPQGSVDPTTGFILPGLSYGKWQPTSSLLKDGSQYKIEIEGNIYLSRTSNTLTLYPGNQYSAYDDGTPMVATVGDTFLVSMVNDNNVPFRAIGNFNSRYISAIKGGGKPVDGTAFQSFYNSYFSNSNNSDEDFINLFGKCDFYNDKTDNCFNDNGRGIVMTIGGTDYSQNYAKYGFPSSVNVNPSQNPTLLQGNIFQVKAMDNGDIKFYIDPQQFPQSQLVGAVKLNIVRLTNMRTQGDMLQAMLVDSSIDLNNVPPGTNLNDKATQVGLFREVTTITPDRPGVLWFRVIDDNYSDNTGEYYIYISKKITSNVIASLYYNFVVPVRAATYSAAIAMYTRTIGDKRFISIARATILLSLVMYGLAFLLGMVREPQMEFVKKMIKMGIIATLISDHSWNFFFNHMFALFMYGTDTIVTAATGIGSDNPFAYLDDMLYRMSGGYLGARIASMIMYGIIGILIMALLIIVIVVIFIAMIKIVMIYTILMIASGFLIALSPIFFIAMMFNQTYKYFDEWLKMLIFTAFQPAILIISTMVVAMVCDILSYAIFADVICWKTAVDMNFSLGIIQFHLFSINWFLPQNMNNLVFNIGSTSIQDLMDLAAEMNIGGLRVLLAVIPFGFGVYLFVKMINQSEQLAAVLFGDMKFKQGVGSAMDDQVEGIVDTIMMIKGALKKGLKDAAKKAGGGKKK